MFELISNPRESEEWKEFANCFPGHPALAHETLYAIPEVLLDGIQAQSRKFFEPRDLAFEKALNFYGLSGFFNRRPFQYPLLDRPIARICRSDEFRQKEVAIAYKIQQGFGISKNGRKRTIAEIDDDLRQENASNETVTRNQAAYAGWLATNPTFRLMRDQMRKIAGEGFQHCLHRCGLYHPFEAEKPTQLSEDELSIVAEFQAFLKYWSLNGLTTWDLPNPIDVLLTSKNRYATRSLDAAGIEIFVPYQMLRNKGLDLHEITESLLGDMSSHQLSPWLCKQPTNWSYDRFEKMLHIHVYWNLAIEQRYADRIRGKTGAIELAFAQFFDPIPDSEDQDSDCDSTIRKIRQYLNQRLATPVSA